MEASTGQLNDTLDSHSLSRLLPVLDESDGGSGEARGAWPHSGSGDAALVWAEIEEGKLRLHGSHASSPENLAQIVEIFEREGGRRPMEKARQERAAAKAKRSRK